MKPKIAQTVRKSLEKLYKDKKLFKGEAAILNSLIFSADKRTYKCIYCATVF